MCHCPLLTPFINQGAVVFYFEESMDREVADIATECLLEIESQIKHGYVCCLLCGDQASKAACWIPRGRDAIMLNVPINRHRIIGYGLCEPCMGHLSEIERGIIAERLSDFILSTQPHMDRGKLPAIFLN